MNEYDHTQPGTLVRVLTGVLLAYFLVFALIAFRKDEVLLNVGIVPAGVSLLILVLFHSLNVCVNKNDITIAFGIGVIRKHFAVGDVARASRVRTHWYNGWGIRKIPKGWLFNVSGRDAVQIEMRNGKVFRIGTDQPDQLLAAINAVIYEDSSLSQNDPQAT